jgi:HAD superfamily hydrolase (TIGR01509 family)
MTPDVTAARTTVERWLTSTRPAVVFDFNGTLSNDEPILFDIFSDLFAARLGWQMTPEEYRDELLGHSDREIIDIAVARHGSGEDDQATELLRLRGEHYKQRVAARNPIADTTVELVTHLARHQIPMAVVTGAQRSDVVAVLDNSAAGRHIQFLVAEEDVANGKPDPEGFLTAARMLRRKPSDILVFEDSVPGVRGAMAAHMHCIAVAAEPTPELRAVAPAIVGELSIDIVSDALPIARCGDASERASAGSAASTRHE